MNKPTVSIITVVYNGEKHLEQTIQSVLAQTYSNIEYIIIDGGSIDNTVDIIRKYEQYITYWISEPDGGIYDAMNKGIRKASGDIIGLLNADDWYETDTIKKVVDNFSDKIDIVSGNCRFWNEENESHINKNVPIERYYTGMPINHPATFVKKRVYEEIGLFSTKYRISADYLFIGLCIREEKVFQLIDEVLTNFRTDGVSKRLNYTKFIENFKVYQELGVRSTIWNLGYFSQRVITYTIKKWLRKK